MTRDSGIPPSRLFSLGYAVNQFFANGGQQAYIVRIVWDGTLAAAPGTTPTPCASASAIGVGAASATITASSGSVSGSAALHVGPAVLQSVNVAPANPARLPIGITQQFAASGNYSDGSNATLSPVTWSASAPGVATVAGSGLVMAVDPGTSHHRRARIRFGDGHRHRDRGNADDYYGDAGQPTVGIDLQL